MSYSQSVVLLSNLQILGQKRRILSLKMVGEYGPWMNQNTYLLKYCRSDDVFGDLYVSEGTESETELDFDSYNPIRPLTAGHDVMIVTPSFARLSHQTLQFMNHGSTVVHFEEESSRSCICFLRLESDNVTLTWRKPDWSALRGNASSLPDYVLRGDFDSNSTQAMYMRYCGGEHVYYSIEEGYLDISVLKHVSWASSDDIDLASISKRYAMENITVEDNCICLSYGTTLAENKHLHFVGPSNIIKTWYRGLENLCHAAKRLRQQIDKRIQWLKIQYLQLYYESERCQGPTPAEAIRVGLLLWSNLFSLIFNPFPNVKF